MQQIESEFKKLLKVALHWSQGISPYDEQLFRSMKADFESIEQKEYEDLDVLIVEKKAKLNCLNIDPNAPKV